MACKQCGGVVPPRDKNCGGNQPGFCSDVCRALRQRHTYNRWVAANREKVLKKHAEYRRGYKESKADYFRTFYQQNKDRRKRESIEWYHANAERAGQRQRVYAAAHPEQTRATGRRSANKRRAIKAKVFVESVDPQVVFTRDKGVCGICKHPVDPASKWEIDHMIPISKGGAHGYVNVQLSHRRCNRQKHAKLPTSQPTLFQVAV